MTKQSTLLPCPFCGSEPRRIDGTVNNVGHFIRCDYCRLDYPTAGLNSEEKAVALWNDRAGADTAQPVAWRWRHSSSRKWTYGEEKPHGPSIHLFKVEPLYAAPRPAQPTREEIIEECAKLCEQLRRNDYSAENGDWTAGTLDCATALRALSKTGEK